MPDLPSVGGLLPPTDITEALIYRAADSTDFELFLFPVSIGPVLLGYETGTKMSFPAENIKSYLFEDLDEIECRNKLYNWIRKIGMYDPEDVVNKCTSWRLVHIQVPDVYYPPKYQGYPVREQDWKRVPSIIKKESRRKVDMFDPLTFMSDPTATFNLDDLLK